VNELGPDTIFNRPNSAKGTLKLEARKPPIRPSDNCTSLDKPLQSPENNFVIFGDSYFWTKRKGYVSSNGLVRSDSFDIVNEPPDDYGEHIYCTHKLFIRNRVGGTGHQRYSITYWDQNRMVIEYEADAMGEFPGHGGSSIGVELYVRFVPINMRDDPEMGCTSPPPTPWKLQTRGDHPLLEQHQADGSILFVNDPNYH